MQIAPHSPLVAILGIVTTLVSGCSPAPDAAVEMQRAIRGHEHALNAALLGAEMFWWAEAPPTVTLRHGETCGCPCREAVDEELLLIDYALDGCRPDSGLIPDELLGHISLHRRDEGVEALVDGLEWEPATEARGSGRSPVGTDLTGRWTSGALSMEGSLIWNDAWAELDLRVVPDELGVTVSGSAQGPDAWVELTRVRLDLADVQGRCPRATGGFSEVWAAEQAVRLDAATSGDLTASWLGETSLPTDPCDVL